MDRRRNNVFMKRNRYIVVRGIVKHTSQCIEITRTKIDKKTSDDEVANTAKELRSIVMTVFRDNKSGYIYIGNVYIDILSFAVLEIDVV